MECSMNLWSVLWCFCSHNPHHFCIIYRKDFCTIKKRKINVKKNNIGFLPNTHEDRDSYLHISKLQHWAQFTGLLVSVIFLKRRSITFLCQVSSNTNIDKQKRHIRTPNTNQKCDTMNMSVVDCVILCALVIQYIYIYLIML